MCYSNSIRVKNALWRKQFRSGKEIACILSEFCMWVTYLSFFYKMKSIHTMTTYCYNEFITQKYNIQWLSVNSVIVFSVPSHFDILCRGKLALKYACFPRKRLCAIFIYIWRPYFSNFPNFSALNLPNMCFWSTVL